jgi:hypothetical protein
MRGVAVFDARTAGELDAKLNAWLTRNSEALIRRTDQSVQPDGTIVYTVWYEED